MRRLGCLLLLLVVVASAQQAQATTVRSPNRSTARDGVATPTANTGVPTVAVPVTTPVMVPTVSLPQPTPTPVHKKKKKQKSRSNGTRPNAARGQWIWAFLTSYCPGSAGSLSSSGMQVFYGMLANDYYPFGTRVYIPVLGMTGVVEDRFGGWTTSDEFDIWSPVCYSTPTGWFKVEILS